MLFRSQKDPFEQATAFFKSLPEDVRKQVESPIEQKHRKIFDAKPSEVPKLEFGGVDISQYDAIFRMFSLSVHGGLPGARMHIQEWLGEPEVPCSPELEIAGPLAAGINWVNELVLNWVRESAHPHLMEHWARCQVQVG